uniref:BZIP domain-containing protein n=1 Tax=Schistosoma mansoni TaxID=6183 RepID=A0A5K4F7Y4_SCHMA
MTEVNEKSDSGINSAPIQLSEDDWLQLLQKLTPSSIESLQQTLKRLQTPEHINTTEKENTSVPFVSCSPSVLAPQPLISQAHPIVMSLGMSKTPIAPVMAMPHVLNISKNTANSLPGRIVLPSSALLIAPSAHGQAYSLDSCLPVADLSRLVVTSGCLPNVASGLLATTTIPESFSSLNTLANAAVAMAANASHWSSGVSIPTTTTTATTTSTTVQMSNSFRFSPIPFTSISTGSTISTCNSVNELIHHSTSTSNSEFTTPILSSLGSTSLTVYPVHVSANGSTVLVASSPTSQDISKSYITTNSSISSSVCSTSFGNYLNSVETSNLSPLSITCSSNLSSNSITSPTPILTSTPRGKPKFKALWESTLSNNERINQSVVNESLTNLEHTIHSVNECTTTNSTLSINSISRTNRTNKRQSPMLGIKSIGQTPKRLAATAATLSQENKSISSDGCKKFLLICSPSKNISAKSQNESDSGICLSSSSGNLSESVLSKNTSSCTELDIIESCNSTTRQLITNISDDRVKLPKNTERNNNISLKQSSLLHSTGSNVSSGRDSSDIIESDPVVSEVFMGKTFENGRRSLKEEPVSDDEARRRAKRRERNRVAAAKCRQRRQDQIEELQHRVDALTRTGQELRSSLHSLDLERARLESLVEEHKIAGCPAAEKVLLMNREYSDNSGSLENCLDLGKTDELLSSNSTFCDEKSVILSSALATKNTVPERLPISSSSCMTSSSHLSSTAGLTTTFSTVNSSIVATTTTTTATSNCGGKSISSHSNVHSNLPKSDLRFHNRLTTNFVPLISNRNNNNSTVITTVSTTLTTSVTTTNTAENNHTATTSSISGSNSTGSLIINSSEEQNRLTSSTLTGANSETSDTSTRKNIVARFVSRPSTLLPSSSLAQPLDVIKAQRQAVSKFADGINQTIHPTTSNNLTPCYWSSDLQNLSPILTPSTWKLLKNLTSSSCINTTTNSHGINTNSIQQSFLLTPTLSPLYPVLPTQTFTSITSMESLRSMSNPTIIITSTTTGTPYSSTTLTNNNSNTTANICTNNDNNRSNNDNGINSTIVSVVESNPTTDVNNNLLINPTTMTTTNINNTTCSSLKTTFDNCDNNTNNNRTSESSNILSKDNDHDKSIVDESSRIILMQQSSQ